MHSALRVLLSAGLVISSCVINAQSVGTYSSGIKREGNEFTFPAEKADIKLEFCTPGMFRVRTSWDRKFEAPENLMVSNYKWAAVNVSTSDAADHLLFQTEKITVKVMKSPFRILVYAKDGKLLNADYGLAAEKRGDTVSCTKELSADEHFFGFGERMDFVDQRSKKIKLNVGRGKGRPHIIGAYNILEANYSPVPFFMSTRGYGIFLHNSFATEWDMGAGSSDRYSFSAAAGELDYYFIYGPDFPSILDSYTALTGKSPLLPRFALGLHAGTYSGGTWGHEKESSDSYVVQLARKFRSLGIPVDLLWLDSTWRIFGKNGGNGATSFEWRDTFNDPKGMFDSLYAMNFKMVGLHLRPRFDNGVKLNLLDQAREKGLVYPEPNNQGEFVNFFDQKSVDWWWDNGVMRVASLGAKFLKTDEGSAFGGLANESDKMGPTDRTAQKLHNVFPVAYAKAPYEKFQEFNKIRGLNQTREGYAGIQRYPFIFAGDWPSEWQYFGPVIKAGLNIGLSGVGYWSHCMGGFEHPADPELYTRWVQFGMFSPIALVFGMDHPGYKEPWNYGQQALDNFKKYDHLRYRLMPYIYSNAYKMYKTGLPLMRALVLEHQHDANVYDIGDQYFFGDKLMVCPVTTKGAQTRTVYLPEGTWYDYWTGKRYQGKQYVHVVTPLDTIPVFARSGSIIPMQPEMLYTDEKPVRELTLDIFPGKSGTFELYEDDGTSLNYKDGKYALTSFSTLRADDQLKVKISKPAGQYTPASRTYLLKIRLDEGEQRPVALQENGKKRTEGWRYEKSENTLYVKTVNDSRKDIDINISFK